MQSLLVMMVAMTPTLLASSTLVREVYGARSFGNQRVPALDKGYLLALTQSSPAMDVYDPSGHFAMYVIAQAPQGSRSVTLSDAAIDTDGSIVATASYTSANGFAGAVVFFDPTGKQVRFIDTSLYIPRHVCFAPDHSVWTLGSQRDAQYWDHADRQDYFMFHKYSLDGKELGAYVRRSLFPKPGLEPGNGGAAGWTIRATKDRIGAFLYPGMFSNDPVWIELDFNGNILGSWHTGKPTNGGHAFTADARLFRTVLVSSGRNPLRTLDEFDRATSSWKMVDTLGDDPTRDYGWLWGADGDNLVFNKDAGLRMFWIRPPAR